MSHRSDLPDYLTVDEVAHMLRLHPRTVRNRIRAGLLPAKAMSGGKSKLIAKSDALAQLRDVVPETDPSVARDREAGLADAPNILVDRLGTPEGRARAVAMLRQLRNDGDTAEQKKAWQALQEGVSPLSLRMWSPDENSDPSSEASSDITGDAAA
jgi:excisionase family DNA binding protein